jgi:heterodisulfide reductase subunit B
MSEENQKRRLSGNVDHRYALFIGCTIPVRENNYEASARAVASALGIEIAEIPGQSCCGLPFRSVDFNAWITLAARNLALADKQDHSTIMTLCNGCYKSLLTASKELQVNEKLRQNVSKRLSVEGLEAKGGVQVKHIAQVLHDDYGVENIQLHVKRPLGSLKVAIHPGCHIVMPSKIIGFDNPAFPKKLDALVESTGAKPAEYETKRLCCGATIVGIKEDVCKVLVRKKIENITGKVDALITFCPICHSTYDVQQVDVFGEAERQRQVPVLHYTQLLGLAMGIPEEKLGFEMNRVDISKLLEKVK